jgi:acyl dehydratase
MSEVWKKPPVSLEAYQAMVGQEIGVSSWHLVDQDRINLYADVIEDHQFIHVDPERARRETAFGRLDRPDLFCLNFGKCMHDNQV